MLLNSVPEHVQFDGVLEELQTIPGVTSVHDLHIWGISSKTVRGWGGGALLPGVARHALCLRAAGACGSGGG